MDSFEDPQVERALDNLRAQKATGKGVAECYDSVLALLRSFGADDSSIAALERARELFEREFSQHKILHECSAVEKHIEWYRGPADDARLWPALKAYLKGKGRDRDTIDELDQASNEIVSMFGNPASQERFSRRGLVVGYVQSGKTANMTAVIAKAVDAGYNMVIVLAGLTEKLRQQTQGRFEQDLFGDRPGAWRMHTSTDAGGDFQKPLGAGGQFVAHDAAAHLLVVKKTTLRHRSREGEFAGPLGKLEATLRATAPVELRKLKVLVLDDECDQATVNSATGDMDVSVINDCVRRALSHLPYVTYVGYTATPFANVLINPWPNDNSQVDGRQLDDLYPKDFITVLPCPQAYFGPERIFGKLVVDSVEEDDGGLPYLVSIPVTHESMLQPASRKDREDFQPSMPESLKDAILYFLACCAARIMRGDEAEHMTMLLHTSVYTDMHERTSTLLEDWTGKQRPLLLDRTSDVSRRLVRLFASEQQAMAGRFPALAAVDPEGLHDHLPVVFRDLEFPIENGASDDRIDYTTGGAKRYIVTGGSILARGLTLEGLMVSYFLRSASQFDTLLQMGRWFGYRTNHEDLPRIWTTPDLQDRFAQLAEVEAHIRRDIARYRENEMTPMQLAVRIPVIPGMAITGAAKMKHAQPARVSYDGQQEQTTRFNHRDENEVRKNWVAGASLLDRADTLDCRDHESPWPLWRGVPVAAISRFLRDYQPHSVQKSLSPELLEAYLDRNKQEERLLAWNVAIVPRREDKNTTVAPLGPVSVTLLQRTKMKRTRTDAAWLKALASARELLVDIPPDVVTSPAPTSWDGVRSLREQHMPGVPLLLLYPIDANYQPEPPKDPLKGSDREALDAVDHLLGYTISFPSAGHKERDLVEVELGPPPAEDVEDARNAMDDERTMAEAAGQSDDGG